MRVQLGQRTISAMPESAGAAVAAGCRVQRDWCSFLDHSRRVRNCMHCIQSFSGSHQGSRASGTDVSLFYVSRLRLGRFLSRRRISSSNDASRRPSVTPYSSLTTLSTLIASRLPQPLVVSLSCARSSVLSPVSSRSQW